MYFVYSLPHPVTLPVPILYRPPSRVGCLQDRLRGCDRAYAVPMQRSACQDGVNDVHLLTHTRSTSAALHPRAYYTGQVAALSCLPH